MTNSRPLNDTISAKENSIYQCAIVDEKGREISITEPMIQRACQALEDDALSFYQFKPQAN